MPHLHLCCKDPENTLVLCTDKGRMNQYLKKCSYQQSAKLKQKATTEYAFGGEAKERKQTNMSHLN